MLVQLQGENNMCIIIGIGTLSLINTIHTLARHVLTGKGELCTIENIMGAPA